MCTREHALGVLRKGVVVLKFGRKGAPHKRFVSLSDDLTTLEWRTKATDVRPHKRTSTNTYTPTCMHVPYQTTVIELLTHTYASSSLV